MKIISWNCRGLGSPRTIPSLKYLVRVYKPDILFLCETISTTNKTEELKYVLDFDCCFTVDRQGRSGGLALYWKSSVNCSISNYSVNHIDAEILDVSKGKWRMTGYYGFPSHGRRRAAWEFLRQLANVSNLPWCILGDFNDILSPTEKKGRSERANWLINGFRNAVSDAGLSDVYSVGYSYTWFKCLGTDRAVEERLDRALATDAWQNHFPGAVLENLPAPSSDHYPIMLLCEPCVRQTRNHSRFKFENAWLIDPDFKSFVNSTWNSYGNSPIVDKLELCAADLSTWSRNHFHHLKRDIDKCRNQLEAMRVQVDSENITCFNNLRNRMNRLLIQEDAFWRQRAKTHWLRDGDLNTKFFHAAASSRRKVNRITSLIDSNNIRVTDEEQLSVVAKDYFSNLFQPQTSDTAPVIEVVNESITLEDNNLLLAPFDIEEFKAAVFSMKPDKCPGPDGYNPGFFQKFWSTCGEELFNQ
jgi:exonuclease III